MSRELSRSRELQRRAERYLPGGVNSPVRAFRAVGGTPRFFQRAAGAHLWDAEGRRYCAELRMVAVDQKQGG